MARDIPCDLDQIEVSKWLIGNLGTGEQTALCDACLVLWMLGKLDEVLEPAAKAHVAGLWAPASPAPAEGEGPPADAPKSRSDGRRRPKPAEGESESDPPAIEAAAAATAAQDPESDRGVAKAPATPDHS